MSLNESELHMQKSLRNLVQLGAVMREWPGVSLRRIEGDLGHCEQEGKGRC